MLLFVNILLGVSVLISIALALFAWRRRPAPGALEFALLMLATAEWTLTYAFELGGNTLEMMVFWARVEYFGVVSLSSMWLLIAMRHAGLEKWLASRKLRLLYIVPILTLLAIWTNGAHHLMWTNVAIDPSDPFPILKWDRGIGFWIFTVYNTLILLIGTILLIRTVYRSKRLYRGQAVVLLAGAMVPWIGSILYLAGAEVFERLIPTPVLFTVTGIALAWGLFRYQLLDIVPVAREAVLESMGDAVLVLDAQNRILDLNPSAGHLIDNQTSEVIGQPLSQVLPISSDFMERITSKPETRTEVVLADEDRKQHTFDPRISLLYDRRGDLVGRLLVLRDITERKQIEEALRIARDQALEASRMKSRLLANVSHELRTPLGAILGYSEFLREGTYGTVSDKQVDTLSKIIESTNYLSELVSRLLEQSQLEAGQLVLHIDTFSIKKLVNRVESNVDIDAQVKGLTLSFVVDNDVPDSLFGDERKIEQVLLNLVSNAIKFTAKGEVRVRIYHPNDVHWVIQVSDTGPGIPDDMRDEIFKPFRRVDDSITREHEGVGLGLSITEQLVMLMDGRIELETKIGEGSTFRIFLPLIFEQEAL